MARNFLGVVAGIIAMWLLVQSIEYLSHVLYPPPPGLNPTDPEGIRRYIAIAPAGAMAMLLAAWLAGSFVGGWTAARIASTQPRLAAGIVGAVVISGVVGMMWLVPEHPYWVSIPGLLLPIPVALLGAALARRWPVVDARVPPDA